MLLSTPSSSAADASSTLSVLDEKYLTPFKVKAWCELSARRKAGEEGNSRHIR